MARPKTVRERVEHLLRSDDPQWRREQLAKIGPEAVVALRGLLSEAVGTEDERRIKRLANLLAFAGGPEDIDVLVAETADEEDRGRWSGWAIALMAFGERALEPLFAAWEKGDAEQRKRITIVLAGCGVHDPRIAEMLLDRLRLGPTATEVPWLIARYDDPELLPALWEVYRGYTIRRDGGAAQGRWLVDLLMAIVELGGELEEQDLNKVRVAQALLEQEVGEERRGTGHRDAAGLAGIGDLAMLARAAKKG